MIAIEVVAFGLGIVLIVLVIGIALGWFGERSGRSQRSTPSVTVVRISGHRDGHEEMQLLVNEQIIRHISDLAMRPADYQAQVEELEKLASSLANALGVEVWLRRLEGQER